MKRRVLVILGHPDNESFCGTLADAYAQGAVASGADVQVLRLGELTFDPVLRTGYKGDQTLEPDLVKAQMLIQWAEHLVFVYPNWWGSMPALLKGFFDRAFTPGFAFKYHASGLGWDRLLSGKSAHLIVTMDTPPWYYRLVYHQPGHRQMQTNILGFCGIRPVRVTALGPVKTAQPKQYAAWIQQVNQLAAR